MALSSSKSAVLYCALATAGAAGGAALYSLFGHRLWRDGEGDDDAGALTDTARLELPESPRAIGTPDSIPTAAPDLAPATTCCFFTDDEELAAELHLRGVDAQTGEPDGSYDVEVRVRCPDGVAKSTSAAYAALHWLRLSADTPAGYKNIRDVLPLHSEISRRGRPYVNTLALLRVPRLARSIAALMAAHVRQVGTNVVVAFETRAMAFATMVATEANCAFIAARRQGRMPGAKLLDGEVRNPESYRSAEHVEVDAEAFLPQDVVVVIDDVVATGSTVQALVDVVQRTGARVAQCVSVVAFDVADRKLSVPVTALCYLPDPGSLSVPAEAGRRTSTPDPLDAYSTTRTGGSPGAGSAPAPSRDETGSTGSRTSSG